MLKPIKKENLSKTIIKALGEYITRNHLKSGDKLPSEEEMSRSFGVARTSVREALKSLEVIGLVEAKPGVGTLLTSDGIDPFLLPLIFGLILEDSDLNQVFQLRIAVETGAVPLIIMNAGNEELKSLKLLAEELDRLKYTAGKVLTDTEKRELESREIEFHQKYIALSHNPILMKFSCLWSTFFGRVNEAGELSINAQKNGIPDEERVMHVAIVDALMKRDITLAMSSVRLHLRYWLERKDDLSPTCLFRQLVESSGAATGAV